MQKFWINSIFQYRSILERQFFFWKIAHHLCYKYDLQNVLIKLIGLYSQEEVRSKSELYFQWSYFFCLTLRIHEILFSSYRWLTYDRLNVINLKPGKLTFYTAIHSKTDKWWNTCSESYEQVLSSKVVYYV